MSDMPRRATPRRNGGQSINALSEALRVDRRTLKKVLAGTAPVSTRAGAPQYRLEDAEAALGRHLRERARLTAPREELLRAQIAKLETQVSIMRREFIPADEVEKIGSEIGAGVRKIVKQIHLAAPSVVGLTVPEAESRLREIENEIIEQLHTLPARLAAMHDSPRG